MAVAIGAAGCGGDATDKAAVPTVSEAELPRPYENTATGPALLNGTDEDVFALAEHTCAGGTRGKLTSKERKLVVERVVARYEPAARSAARRGCLAGLADE